MTDFNKNITQLLNRKFKDLSFDKEDGRFLADKSYGFDTMFFMSRFIDHFRFGNKFDKAQYREYSLEYTKYLFTLGQNASQVQNYLTETISTLCFTNVLKTIRRGLYEIEDEELLLFVSSSFENAYIFLYMLSYNLFRRYGWWPLYKKFCQTDNITEQQRIVMSLRNKMIEVNPNIKNAEGKSNWAMFLTKYPLMILNYANGQHHISRMGNVSENITTIEDVALNTRGTRSNYDIKKKNDYLYTFSKEYVLETLRPYLAVAIPRIDSVEYSPSLAEDIADQKLKLFDQQDHVLRERKALSPKYRQSTTGKVRTMQSEFRSGLLKTVPHVCPVCGFKYKDFLVASHILPYSKCPDAYDAMNSNNGLLLCPVCDKLFESANYITIDAYTGEIRRIREIDDETDFQFLHGAFLPTEYIDCERRHYLKWHNEEFNRRHGK